jgi:hypothetical protein
LANELNVVTQYYLGAEEIDLTKEMGTLRVLIAHGDVTTAVFKHMCTEGTSFEKLLEGNLALREKESHKYDYENEELKTSGQWEVIQSYGTQDLG